MEHKKFAVVMIAAVLASLMLAGTILAPIQSYAAAKRGTEADFPDTSSLKHAVLITQRPTHESTKPLL
jgi:hypothetical protein